jgi:hypothetical protein
MHGNAVVSWWQTLTRAVNQVGLQTSMRQRSACASCGQLITEKMQTLESSSGATTMVASVARARFRKLCAIVKVDALSRPAHMQLNLVQHKRRCRNLKFPALQARERVAQNAMHLGCAWKGSGFKTVQQGLLAHRCIAALPRHDAQLVQVAHL